MNHLPGTNADKPTEHTAVGRTESPVADGHAESQADAISPDGYGCSASSSGPLSRPLRQQDLVEGAKRLKLVLRARELLSEGMSWRDMQPHLSRPVMTVWKYWDQVRHLAHPTASDLAALARNSGRKRIYRPLTSAEATAVKRAVQVQTNRTSTAGSVPQALRIAAMRGEIGADLIAQITDRANAGQPLLTEAQARDVRVGEVLVRAQRGPRNAWLDYVQSPGSTMLTIDAITGEERMLHPGERFTIDDGTINLGCWLALERPGDRCFDRFGIIVGRFQFLLVVDCRTHFITGFSYTARPKGQYRAEDLTATMHNTFCEHGMPREMLLEYGISAADLVHQSLELAGVTVLHANSPHQKIVEGVFNKLWTKLSAMPGQMGRFRGEEEEMGRVYEACKRGDKDPRHWFASLPEVVTALREAIAEHNAQWVNSDQYGRWIPSELFSKSAHKTLRPLAPEMAWMFSPVITQPLTIRGYAIGTTVNLMPGVSIKFHFDAGDIAAEFMGALVKLHFNPFAPECIAKITLAEEFNGHAKGELLGDAAQFNRHARFTRRAFGYGMDPDIGREMARAHAQALHRTRIAVRADGQRGRVVIEERAGNGDLRSAELAGGSGRAANGAASQREADHQGQRRNVTARRGLLSERPPAEEMQRQRSTFAALAKRSREQLAVLSD